MEKEDYYNLIKEIREVVKDPEKLKCTCQNTYCEWYGKCRECIAMHRHYGKHVPACMQFILRDKIKALAETAELHTSEFTRTPLENWQYVREMDEKNL